MTLSNKFKQAYKKYIGTKHIDIGYESLFVEVEERLKVGL